MEGLGKKGESKPNGNPAGGVARLVGSGIGGIGMPWGDIIGGGNELGIGMDMEAGIEDGMLVPGGGGMLRGTPSLAAPGDLFLVSGLGGLVLILFSSWWLTRIPHREGGWNLWWLSYLRRQARSFGCWYSGPQWYVWWWDCWDQHRGCCRHLLV